MRSVNDCSSVHVLIINTWHGRKKNSTCWFWNTPALSKERSNTLPRVPHGKQVGSGGLEEMWNGHEMLVENIDGK